MRALVTALIISLGLASFEAAWADDENSTFHLQATTVSQEHAAFTAPYSGQNSLSPGYEEQTSLTWTIFAGQRLWRGAEFYIDPELAGGSGFSHTQGIAGFPNGEIYRVDDPSPKWNLARMYLKQVFGLGGAQETIKDDENQIATTYDVRRLTVTVGKFALNDFLDNNSYSHNPRTQFLNWALMDYGAWDYAADTRGYSWGVFLEYNESNWALRFASVMVPLRANQLEMDTDFPSERGDNLEFEYRYSFVTHPGVFRLLAYENHADMGNYRTTITTPADNMDITKSHSHSVKYGFGFNAEQAFSNDLGGFLRISWNDGHTETWAFTEIDQSLSLGLNLKGTAWKRSQDTIGAALIVNGLSDDHRDYLQDGGYGFLIGDGKLNYAPEEIAEFYYSAPVVKDLNLTGDYQFVNNPAYNSDRGPVSILSIRLHYEI